MGNSGFKGKQREQVIQMVAPPFGQFHKQFTCITNRPIKISCAINGIACFKKCKQLFEYQHLLLLRDISGLYYKTITIVIMTIISDATIWRVTFDDAS